MRTDQRLNLGSHDALGDDFPFEQHPGVSHSGNERNHLFMNRGDGEYLDVSPVSGLDDVADGRAWTRWDYDHDGWSDIAVVNANAPQLRLYRNRIGEQPGAEASRWIAVRLVGGNRTAGPNPELSPRDGYGAKLRFDLGDAVLVREHLSAEGFATQNSATQLVGLGSATSVASLTVEWPSGRSQTRSGLPAGKLVFVYEDPTQSPDGEAFTVTDYPARRGSALARASRGSRSRPVAIPASAAAPARLTVLTTMATWCPKCKGELPQLAELRSRFSDEEVALRALPIDPDDDASKLAAYRAEFDPPYELIESLSPAQIERLRQRIGRESGLEDPLPASLVLDRNGRVLFAAAGVPSVSDVREFLGEESGESR